MFASYGKLLFLAAVACAGKGSIGKEADDEPGVGDADTDTDTDADSDTDADTDGGPTDTGTYLTPPAELTVTSVTRVGVTLDVHFETDGVAGPWTISIAGVPTVVAEADLATWDPSDGEATWAGPYDPCTALGTLVPVEVTDGTLTGLADIDLAGSTVAIGAPSGNYRDIDLTLLPAPFALCEGVMSQGDFYGRVLALPVVADWLVSLVSDGDLVLSEAAFPFTDEVEFNVTPGPGLGAPTPFTVFVDQQ